MGIQQSGIYELLKKMEILLEKSFAILPNYLVVIKVKDMEALIDRIYANLPTEIQEARGLLKRKDDFQLQAQQEAQRIILDAQNQANRLVDESETLRNLQKRSDQIKDQTTLECDEIRKRALNDAENIRMQAIDEANRWKDQIEIYAEKTLAELEHKLTVLQKEIKEGQIYMEKLRAQNSPNFNKNMINENSSEENSGEFVIE